MNRYTTNRNERHRNQYYYQCRQRQKRALGALQTLIPTHIRDVVPGMIKGHPSRKVLDRLLSMVRDDNCAHVALDILMNDCSTIGRKLAENLINCPQ